MSSFPSFCWVQQPVPMIHSIFCQGCDRAVKWKRIQNCTLASSSKSIACIYVRGITCRALCRTEACYRMKESLFNIATHCTPLLQASKPCSSWWKQGQLFATTCHLEPSSTACLDQLLLKHAVQFRLARPVLHLTKQKQLLLCSWWGWQLFKLY